MAGKLYRDSNQGKLAGVCAGFADYFGIDVAIVRVIWLVMVFAASFGLLLYLACWIVLPERRDVVKVMREDELSAEMRSARDAGHYETE
jgi:phage shock protein PspC (stress-responsive transcriptional regulator)